MSYHIVSIDEADCSLSVSRGQLVVSGKNGTRTLPMEDIASIVITSFKCTFSNHFFIEAAKRRVGVVLCDTFQPSAVVLPANRATDTEIIRNLSKLSAQSKHRLWGKTMDAKCMNQYVLAKRWAPNHPLLPLMLSLAQSTKETREAEVAKMYWNVFSETFCEGRFSRWGGEDSTNALLNYGYAILLSLVLRNLFAIGLDPIFGIFHTTRAHAAPLAYDLMEPFRPIIDAYVADWVGSHEPERVQGEAWKMPSDYRRYIAECVSHPIVYDEETISLKLAVEKVIRTFRKAVSLNQVGPYEPWKTSTIKWDG